MECKTTAVTTCGDSCIVFVAGVNEGRANVGWSCECVVVFVGWYFVDVYENENHEFFTMDTRSVFEL
jgi:hypothetical protein